MSGTETTQSDTKLILSEMRSLKSLMEERKRIGDERHFATIALLKGQDERTNSRFEKVEKDVETVKDNVVTLQSTADTGTGAIKALLWVGGFAVGLAAIASTAWSILTGSK